MRTGIVIIAAFGACLFMAEQIQATPQLIVRHDGDVNEFEDWSISAVPGSPSITQSDLNDGGGSGVSLGGQNALQVDASTSGETQPYTALIGTGAGDLTGSYTAFPPHSTELVGIAFDFYAGGGGPDGDAPQEMGAYFIGANGESWTYAFNPANITSGWGTYYANFAGGSGWLGWGSTPFDGTALGGIGAALADVTQVGVYITYLSEQAGQIYGVDNFGLTVPEPETYMILGMALLSVAVVFRKRITDSLAEARAMLQV